MGYPTCITLLALGFFFGWAGFGLQRVSDLMVSRYFFVISNDVLIPVCIFVFMGYVVERSGILDRLFRSIQIATGPVRGSLYLTMLLTCTIFAAETGTIGASVTTMGLLAMPAMMRAKYDVRLSAGVITGGGCLKIFLTLRMVNLFAAVCLSWIPDFGSETYIAAKALVNRHRGRS